jgi:hypothetical protein
VNHRNPTKFHRELATALLCAWTALTGGTLQAATEKTQLDYARSRLDAVKKAAEFRLAKKLGHPEAFRIEIKNGRTVIEADSPAGLIYGAQAVVRDEAQAGHVQQPDFDVRGTTLWIAGAVSGGRIAAYHAQLNADDLVTDAIITCSAAEGCVAAYGTQKSMDRHTREWRLVPSTTGIAVW